MPFVPGDHVHVAVLGKGIVREVRNGERYLVEVKGRSIVTTADRLTQHDPPRKAAKAARAAPRHDDAPQGEAPSLDLHGQTVAEAIESLHSFINSALLAGSAEARIIHGRSGGKIRSAVHMQLKGMRAIRRFLVDPRNAGVTIVEF